MAAKDTTFAQLEEGFSTAHLHARLLHFWEAKNRNQGNTLMGLELLLLDETSTLLEAFVPSSRISRFQPTLKSQAVYSLRNFRVNNNKTTYKVADHKFKLLFTDQTVLQEIGEEGHTIPKEKFRFRTFEEFDSNADLNENLCDALGKVVALNDEQAEFDTSEGKISIHLQFKSDLIARVTLWPDVAAKFRTRLSTVSSPPRVVLATAINPRRFGGLLYLNSSSATRFYFDNDIEATTTLLTWLNENPLNGGPIDFPAAEVIKLETVTLAELHEFLASKTPQRAGFTCTATIADISPDYGWNYVACTKCSCKLNRAATSLACNNCKNPNAVGILRFRVELSVRDGNEDLATFVMFDRETTQMIGKKASDIVDDEGGSSAGGASRRAIPECLLALIGKTITFQVKVTEYNFTATRQSQTITVARILSNTNAGPEAPSMLKEDVGINGNIMESLTPGSIGESLDVKDESGEKQKGKRAKHA